MHPILGFAKNFWDPDKMNLLCFSERLLMRPTLVTHPPVVYTTGNVIISHQHVGRVVAEFPAFQENR
jgi:hypothetical protein